jgi:hypothetical protein
VEKRKRKKIKRSRDKKKRRGWKDRRPEFVEAILGVGGGGEAINMAEFNVNQKVTCKHCMEVRSTVKVHAGWIKTRLPETEASSNFQIFLRTFSLS